MNDLKLSPVAEQARRTLESVRKARGFIKRPQQQALTDALVEKMVDGGQLMLEAPTGTGKTLAYLSGAVAISQEKNKKLVIATGTLNLQKQLLEKDLPYLVNDADLALEYTVAKGRGNYACLLRVHALLDDSEQASMQPDLEMGQVISFSEINQRKLPSKLMEKFTTEEWDGDLDGWAKELIAKEREAMVSTRESCTGRNCEYFQQCGYQKMRVRIMQADVVVTNHALLLNDLELGSGILLPNKNECLYVVDEAHDLPRKAVDQSKREFGFRNSLNLLNMLKTFQKQFHLYKKQHSVCTNNDIQSAVDLITEIESTLQQNGLIESLKKRHRNQSDPDTRILRETELYLYLQLRGKDLSIYLKQFIKILDKQIETIREKDETGTPDVILPVEEDAVEQDAIKPGNNSHFHQYMLMQCSIIKNHISSANDCWQLFLHEIPETGPDYSRWLKLGRYGEQHEIVLACSATWPAEYLQRYFWAESWGVVLVSATLRALGNFSYMRKLTGLYEPVPAIEFDSGFNYSKQAVLTVPWMQHQPGSNDRDYFKEISTMLPALMRPGEGGLVLFTSRTALEQTYQKIPSGLRGSVFAQGQGLSRNEIIKSHEKRVKAGKRSVIFGLNSFAEGVDLPGDLCRHVVITRLPFPPFDNTIARNLKDWMGSQYFMGFSMPTASIRLIQACGRLLRNEKDTGRITVLDRRLVLKDYGSKLLNTLPDYHRQIEHTALPDFQPAGSLAQAGGMLVF